jgi:hypothetical protein
MMKAASGFARMAAGVSHISCPIAGGGRRRKYVYGKTRREAHDRLVEMIQQVNRGIPVPLTSQSVGE